MIGLIEDVDFGISLNELRKKIDSIEEFKFLNLNGKAVNINERSLLLKDFVNEDENGYRFVLVNDGDSEESQDME